MNFSEALTDYYRNKGKIANWAGILAMQDLERKATEQRKNQEAESSHVRKTVWGYTEPDQSDDDDMGTTILGDVTQQPAVVIPQSGNKLLTTAALAAMLTTGGLAGYVISGLFDKDGPAPTFSDETLEIGLGRIEDIKQ